MNRYLIFYGADNNMATFEADNPQHAIEQFINWAPVSPNDDDNAEAINEVAIIIPVRMHEETESGVYAVIDKTFGSIDRLLLTTVPNNIINENEIEDFLVNHRGDD